ncbi:MAG TPA: TlpA disulfide reductase family protein [Pedobacter sp.]|uniref:TlpA family protein disulfide reductase n=1 Tax=Pedobacter sp. TaxID=1411316 RepID=UPI002CED42AB|nr:TlpA disulfide reductase family protein [Pedobacter sp.]HMI03397.1 TlpA disulfide reductase family protein [Pedobacter sp.]
MIRFIFFFSAILIGLLGSLKAQRPIRISGTTEEMKDNNISVRRLPAFVIHNQKIIYLAAQSSKTGVFDFSFSIKKPELLIFSAVYKNWFIYFKPGDSVSFKITGKARDQQLVFSGKDEARYNLDVLISDASLKTPYYPKYNNLIDYKEALNNWKKTSEMTLETYLTNHLMDKATADLAKDKLSYRYVQLIYSGLVYSKQEIIPANYFMEAAKYPFTRDELLLTIEYRNAVYYRYIARNATNQTSDLEAIYQGIQLSLKGKTRDYALSYLAGEYALKQSTDDSRMLRKLFDRLYEKKPDSLYLSYLKDNEMRYFIIGKPLPDTILNKTLLTSYSDDKLVSLAELLDSYKGKAVYIDMWASWCAPCRDDISKSSDTKKMLGEKDVSYLYFSTDADERAWKKASEQDRTTANQYLLKADSSKQFKRFIELSGIPRYLILDKDHHVVDLFAPRPIPDQIEELRKIVSKVVQMKL